MNDFESLKETLLNEAPRFKEKDSFKFSCRKDLSCFTHCCGDVNIFLTPYDVLRMKNHLGLSSEDFLARYTLIPFNEEQQMPIVVLKMSESEGKPCPFVNSDGCSIYEDRPWSCRMYPLGFASPKEGATDDEEFYFLMQEGDCRGFEDGEEITVGKWLKDQGIIEYNEMGSLFKDISLHDHFQKGGTLDPQQMEMFYVGCYNLDKFRRFIFESSFLDSFEVQADLLEAVKHDDVELMKFAFMWLRYSLFGEPLMIVRREALDRKRSSMGNLTGL
jgi:hypothetical protein